MCRISTISKLNADRSNEHHLKHNESCNKALIELDNMPMFLLLFYIPVLKGVWSVGKTVGKLVECWENCWETV